MGLSGKRPTAGETDRGNDAERERILEAVTAEPVQRLNANVPRSLLREAKAKAATRGETLTEVVTRALREYVSK